MTPEEQFIENIKEATGLELGKDYGFIIGTHSPYMEKGNLNSFQSSNIMHRGFAIWKKKSNQYGRSIEEIKIVPKNAEDSFNQIINFLKD